MDAHRSCWEGLSSHMRDVLEEATNSTFRELEAYANAQHAGHTNSAFGRHRLVPTALAVAGSMNAADHAGTFSALVSFLRAKGCHAALLQHQDLAANKGISGALNSILQQLSGLDTDACDMEALQAWHGDRTASSASPRGAVSKAKACSSPAKRPKPSQEQPEQESPAKRRQVGASARTTRSKALAQQSAAPAPEAHSPAASLVSDSDEDSFAVYIGSDKSSESSPEPPAGAALPAQPGPSQRQRDTAGSSQEARHQASSKPLVVVIENTEAADLSTLQDLILVLSEARAQLPVTLVLGMSISVAALRHMLPVKAADLLQAKEFRLVQAKALLDSLVQKVLLGPRFHGLLFSHRLLDDLLHHFLSHDFSVSCIRQGLQIACLRHFQSEALSVLVPAAVSGPAAVGKACDRLPQALRGSIEGRNARQCASKLASAWAAWAVSLHWLHDAAQALGMGHSTASDGFSLTSLYVDASAPGYMAQGGLGQRRLRAVCDGVERLGDARCRELAEALLRSCRGVAGGPQAAAAELACVEGLLTETRAPTDPGGAPAAGTPQPAATLPAPLQRSAMTPATPALPRRDSLASMLKKQKAPLSATQRKQQLLGGSQMGKEVAGTPQARGLGVAPKPQVAVRLAGLIQQAALAHLSKPPSSLAGAKAICCNMHAEVKDMMSSAPRWAVHQALAERTPATYAARQAPAQELGMSPDMEDAAIAYRLLLEYGESVGVADWFQSFCAVFHTPTGQPEAENAGRSSKACRRQSKKKQQQQKSNQAAITQYMPGKTRGQRGLPSIPESFADKAGEAAEEPSARSTRGRGAALDADAGKQKAKGAVGASVSKEKPDACTAVPAKEVPLQDLAVRFSCATRELQFLGLIKEASRSRRDGAVQRLAYPMRVQTA
ncbi:hypothetical protein CVIRNUC_008106 [Coccomyxa viridis]|uniref:Origin recognition complex subunit 3 n=1 Tax=Coccomyxa viridis TaxID=1274662 RepID=A0AAV1IDM6_9CHLO|nr:hypothetical protein CVIRNUC_008106 [Coccomyxa viridis]